MLKFVLFLESAGFLLLSLSAVASHFGKLLKEFNSLLNIQSFIMFSSGQGMRINPNRDNESR